MYCIMSSANSEFYFVFSSLDSFSFSSLIAVDKTLKTMLNNSGKSGHPCLVPDLGGNVFSFSSLRIMFGVFIMLLLFIAQSCPTLCDPMDCSTPGLPFLHHLQEFGQDHVHCISDDVQPSHPLMPSSPCLRSFPASGTFPMSYLFTADNQNNGVSASTSALTVNIQGCSPLRLTGLISLVSKGLSGVFSSTTVQRHQFFGVLLFLQSSSHNHT